MAYNSAVFDLDLGLKRKAPRKYDYPAPTASAPEPEHREESGTGASTSSSQSAAESPAATGMGLVDRINEDGVVFRSYRDGHKVLLTPEISAMHQIKASCLLYAYAYKGGGDPQPTCPPVVCVFCASCLRSRVSCSWGRISSFHWTSYSLTRQHRSRCS